MKHPAVVALEEAAKAAPPMRGPIVLVSQLEERHPSFRGKVRRWIMCADAGMIDYDGLRSCVIRLGRSVMLDEAGVLAWLASLGGKPPAPARNPHGRAGKPKTRAKPKRSRGSA